MLPLGGRIHEINVNQLQGREATVRAALLAFDAARSRQTVAGNTIVTEV